MYRGYWCFINVVKTKPSSRHIGDISDEHRQSEIDELIKSHEYDHVTKDVWEVVKDKTQDSEKSYTAQEDGNWSM